MLSVLKTNENFSSKLRHTMTFCFAFKIHRVERIFNKSLCFFLDQLDVEDDTDTEFYKEEEEEEQTTTRSVVTSRKVNFLVEEEENGSSFFFFFFLPPINKKKINLKVHTSINPTSGS